MSRNNKAEQTKKALREADAILIGAGAGLSEAAGLEYSGKRFTDHFAPFIRKYGLKDMYSAGFYPFPSEEEKWAYWAGHILINRFDTPPAALYRRLLDVVRDKPYFVITTNVDGQFVRAGFPAEKVFATQGDYRYIQCARACHQQLYDDEALVREMVAQTKECRIPAPLVPQCPVCGGRMMVNLRCDEFFVQDTAWYDARSRYEQFLEASAGKRLVLLELGVGYNTPGIIRYPFEQMTYHNRACTLIRLNRDNPDGIPENEAKTISFAGNMAEVLEAL